MGADQPRLRLTLQTVAQACNWQAGPAAGRFRGVAAHESFKGFAAMVIEVSVDPNSAAGVRVHEVWCAIDCGVAVNPDGIAQQVEGSVVFGLSAALYGEISLENGMVSNPIFTTTPCCATRRRHWFTPSLCPAHWRQGAWASPRCLAAPALANANFCGERQTLASPALGQGRWLSGPSVHGQTAWMVTFISKTNIQGFPS